MVTDREFELLKKKALEVAGIEIPDMKRSILELRINKRLKEKNMSSVEEWLRYISFDKSELDKFIDFITVGETYFFRTEYQLEIFAEYIIPELKNHSFVKIWSAGCSTGAEPYTIAIIMLENGVRNFKVVGTDINQFALQQAKEGVYSKRAIDKVPPDLLKKYFVEKDNSWVIKPELKRYVEFRQLNLVDTTKMMLMRGFHTIFCRNVIIYFPLDVKKKVVRNFYFALEPGGYLILGHSETLSNITTSFEVLHFKGAIVYRKPVEE